MVYITDVKFYKTLEPIQNSRRQTGDMNQVLDEDPHVLDATVQKFEATVLAHGICALLFYTTEVFFICLFVQSV
jgi:hypothetical protein